MEKMYSLSRFLFQPGNTESPRKSVINGAENESCAQDANGKSSVS